MDSTTAAPRVRIRDLVLYYLRLGTLGFGGPVALCGQMERELVQERKWLSREEMRDGIAVCQSLSWPSRNSGGNFRFVPARRVLGSVGRRLGIHPTQLYHCFGSRSALRPIKRSAGTDCNLLWCESGGHRTHRALVLPAREARHGGLGAVGYRGSLLCGHGRSTR